MWPGVSPSCLEWLQMGTVWYRFFHSTTEILERRFNDLVLSQRGVQQNEQSETENCLPCVNTTRQNIVLDSIKTLLHLMVWPYISLAINFSSQELRCAPISLLRNPKGHVYSNPFLTPGSRRQYCMQNKSTHSKIPLRKWIRHRHTYLALFQQPWWRHHGGRRETTIVTLTTTAPCTSYTTFEPLAN